MLLAKPMYRWTKRQISHHHAATLWEQTKSQSMPSVHSGDPVYWLQVPDCDIDQLVLQKDTESNLTRHPSLALSAPKVILGHRDTHFRHLKKIKLQDPIHLEDPNGTLRTYRVTDIEILPADRASTRLKEHRNSETLVLMTCYPFTFIGPAPDRFIVWAVQKEFSPPPPQLTSRNW